MSEATAVSPGSPIVMHFSLSLEDGTDVVSTFAEEPMAFTLGDGTMEPALEQKLIGLQPGDEQALLLDGSDIYGARDPDNIQWIDIDEFPASIMLAEGQVIAFSTPQAEEVAGRVETIEDSRVALDFNHPLSGRTIIFTAKILKVGNGG